MEEIINKILPKDIKNIKRIDIDFDFWKYFLQRLEKIDYEFTDSEKCSGLVCFYGSIAVSLLHTGKIEHIEELFNFTLSYMLIDNFLDNEEIDEKEKDKTMNEIYQFLLNLDDDFSNNLDDDFSNNKIISILKNMNFLLNTERLLLTLFKSEIKGAEISKRKDYNRDVYKLIAEEKGGNTALAIASIICIKNENENENENENKNENNEFLLGSIIQLIDDLLDIEDDKKSGIYTLALYDIDHGQNLDNYIEDLIINIDKLNSKYTLFKIIFILSIILFVKEYPIFISESLISIFQKYDPFDINTTKKTIMSYIFAKYKNYKNEQ